MIYAFCSEEKAVKLFGICSLISRSFTRFFTGQCLEALILGGLFLLTLTIFRMPYALLISVVIASTALIPIFGAFAHFYCKSETGDFFSDSVFCIATD